MGGKQLKVRLPLAFVKLPQQNYSEVIKWFIRFIACRNLVQNVLKDLLGQVGKSIGGFKLLRFDTCRGDLRLDEVELALWFRLSKGLDCRSG
jgi:hypothetical protein